jgi:hypothetical protein
MLQNIIVSSSTTSSVEISARYKWIEEADPTDTWTGATDPTDTWTPQTSSTVTWSEAA